MATDEDHAAALKALLTSLGATPYDLDEVPATQGRAYTEVYVSERFGDNRMRLGAWTGTRSYRVSLRAVGRTVTDARIQRGAADLRFQTITVGGVTSTPIQFETAEDIGSEDNGQWFTGLSNFTYSL